MNTDHHNLLKTDNLHQPTCRKCIGMTLSHTLPRSMLLPVFTSTIRMKTGISQDTCQLDKTSPTDRKIGQRQILLGILKRRTSYMEQDQLAEMLATTLKLSGPQQTELDADLHNVVLDHTTSVITDLLAICKAC